MNKYSCFIIDDETKSAELLRLLVEEVDPNISIEGVYNNPLQALDELKLKSPDFIFLDIEMPHMNGIQFAEKISHLDIPIVFVTSFANYAIDAIKKSALGYIVKPIDIKELKETINKVRNSIAEHHEHKLNRILLGDFIKKEASNKTIGIPSNEGLDFVSASDILYCEGKERYTEVVLQNDKIILSSYSLGKFAEILDQTIFFQVHRSFILNLSRITQYKKEGIIVLQNGASIPLARRRKEEFMERIIKIGS